MIYFPQPALLPTLLRESFAQRTLEREPETDLIMEDEIQVQAYVQGGKANALEATYLYIQSQLTPVIQGKSRVLDLGCGPATLLCQVAALNPENHFTGVDLSPTMLAEAQKAASQTGLTNVDFKKSDITALQSIDDQSYDAVISTFALHHLPTYEHLENCFKEIHRVLKPDGAIFLFDFGRLKCLKSVIEVAYLNPKGDPYLFTLDKERSMRAAFTLEDFKNLNQKEFSGRCEVLSTFKVPVFIMVRTQPHSLAKNLKEQFKAKRKSLSARSKQDIDDMRFFFYLDGVRNDVF